MCLPLVYSFSGITGPEYSIDVGVQSLAYVLSLADVESPIDIEKISLALQGYNFGSGYIYWAVENYGGYSAANAIEFSEMMAEEMGWSGYGDIQYVPHVLRYYPFRDAIIGDSQAFVQVALSQVGNTGGQPYWSWYGYNYRVEWCACFVSWCGAQCGYIDSGLMPKFAYCPEGVQRFKDNGRWQDRSYTPKPGDLIFFDWESDGISDHVGIVEKVENGAIYTVEGNVKDSCVKKEYQTKQYEIYRYGLLIS